MSETTGGGWHQNIQLLHRVDEIEICFFVFQNNDKHTKMSAGYWKVIVLQSMCEPCIEFNSYENSVRYLLISIQEIIGTTSAEVFMQYKFYS